MISDGSVNVWVICEHLTHCCTQHRVGDGRGVEQQVGCNEFGHPKWCDERDVGNAGLRTFGQRPGPQ